MQRSLDLGELGNISSAKKDNSSTLELTISPLLLLLEGRSLEFFLDLEA